MFQRSNRAFLNIFFCPALICWGYCLLKRDLTMTETEHHSDLPSIGRVESVHLSCAVTCVKLDSSGFYLFACQGPAVILFRLCLNSNPLSTAAAPENARIDAWLRICTLGDVLPASRIHGVRTRVSFSVGDCDDVVFFGQKRLRLAALRRGGAEARLILREIVDAPDWLWEVAFLGSSPQLVLVTAHNQLRRYDTVTKKTMDVADAAKKHILYSASIVTSDAWCQVVVAAGTVFNHIVIWGPTNDAYLELKGHDGVIFALQYEAEIQTLASASDDRSVRLWKFRRKGEKTDLALTSSSLSEVTPVLISTLYGHSARVWDVTFFNAGSKLVSIGEDAALLLWDLATNRIEKKFQVEGGPSLLCVEASHNVARGRSSIFSGGNNGGVTVYEVEMLKNTMPDRCDDNKSPQSSSDTEKIVLFRDSEFGDSAKSVAFTCLEEVIVMTGSGKVYAFHLDDPSPVLIFSDVRFASYSVMAARRRRDSTDGRRQFAIGNIHGVLKFLQITDYSDVAENFEIQLANKKIHSIHFLNLVKFKTSEMESSLKNGDDPDDNDQEVEEPDECHVLISYQDGMLYLLTVDFEMKCCETIATFTLPTSKQRWVTTGLLLLTPGRHMHLVCGDRNGSVHLFGSDLRDPISTLYRVHSKAGTTCLAVSLKEPSLIHTIGRDGFRRSVRIIQTADSWLLDCANGERVGKGFDWLERLSFGDGRNVVLGFHGDTFVEWDPEERRRRWTIKCGGGHRSWDYVKREKCSRFVGVLKGDAVLYERTEFDDDHGGKVLIEALHRKEITSVAILHSVSFMSEEASMDRMLVATGSEDTTVSLWSVSIDVTSKKASHRIVRTLKRHISSVRDMTFFKRPRDIVLVSSGGRGQICVWLLDINESGPDFNVFASLLAEERTSHKKRHKEAQTMDIRYMSLDLKPTGEDGLLLATACSDGLIKVFEIEISKKRLSLMAKNPISSCQKCFLTVRFGNSDNCLFSSSTDGFLRVWRLAPRESQVERGENHSSGSKKSILTLDLIQSFHCHQSGFSTIDVISLGRQLSSILIISGGDDNSVCISRLNKDLNYGLWSQKVIPKAHASQVTSVQSCSESLDNVLSAGIDQRINVWSLVRNESNLDEVEFCISAFSNVPDIASTAMETIKKRRYLIVVGAGIEILQFTF